VNLNERPLSLESPGTGDSKGLGYRNIGMLEE